MIGGVSLSWHGSLQTNLGFAICKPAAFGHLLHNILIEIDLAAKLHSDLKRLIDCQSFPWRGDAQIAQTMKCGEKTPRWKIQAIQHAQTIPKSYAMFQHISCIIFPYHRSSFFSSKIFKWLGILLLAKGHTSHSDLFPSSYQALVGCLDPFLQRGLIVIQAQLPFTMGGDVIQHHLKKHRWSEKVQGSWTPWTWKFWSKIQAELEMKQMDAMTKFFSWIASGNKLWRYIF